MEDPAEGDSREAPRRTEQISINTHRKKNNTNFWGCAFYLNWHLQIKSNSFVIINLLHSVLSDKKMSDVAFILPSLCCSAHIIHVIWVWKVTLCSNTQCDRMLLTQYVRVCVHMCVCAWTPLWMPVVPFQFNKCGLDVHILEQLFPKGSTSAHVLQPPTTRLLDSAMCSLLRTISALLFTRLYFLVCHLYVCVGSFYLLLVPLSTL